MLPSVLMGTEVCIMLYTVNAIVSVLTRVGKDVINIVWRTGL